MNDKDRNPFKLIYYKARTAFEEASKIQEDVDNTQEWIDKLKDAIVNISDQCEFIMGIKKIIIASMITEENPFMQIKKEADKAFEICDHLTRDSSSFIQGLVADISCYVDFIMDVEMPN